MHVNEKNNKALHKLQKYRLYLCKINKKVGNAYESGKEIKLISTAIYSGMYFYCNICSNEIYSEYRNHT